MSGRRIVGVIAIVLLSMSFVHRAEAADLTVGWNPATDGLTTGFVLYYGTASRSYSQQVNVGSTTSYTVTGLTAGTTYYFAVRGYDAAGDLSDFSAEVSATTSSPSPMTALALTSNLPSPEVAGTTITWSATPTGGTSPYLFQWSVYHAGAWTVGSWTSSSTFAWTPTVASTDYFVRVAALSSGSNNPAGDLSQNAAFTITAAPTPTPTPSASPATVSLSTTMTSPQPAGTTINWSASASGGTAPYQFEWWVYNGNSWSAATTWTTSSTWSWKPGAAGTYSVRVWVRSAGNSANAPEGTALASFTITKKCQGKGCK